MKPIFRLNTPTEDDIATFHQDGYVVFPEAFTDEGLTGLIDEILNLNTVKDYFKSLADLWAEANNPPTYFVRPWNDRGPWGDRLIDAPLVTALLQATIGTDYHFCHSAMNIAPRGTKRLGFHQDQHHWFHENPINLGRKLEAHRLELPPGSMVYLNARTFHGVESKPLDALQEFRLFVIDIFKQAGPPHRYTQEIPAEWMDNASPARKKMFLRETFSEGCWSEK